MADEPEKPSSPFVSLATAIGISACVIFFIGCGSNQGWPAAVGTAALAAMGYGIARLMAGKS